MHIQTAEILARRPVVHHPSEILSHPAPQIQQLLAIFHPSQNLLVSGALGDLKVEEPDFAEAGVGCDFESALGLVLC